MDRIKSYILEQLASKNITKEQAKVMLMELSSNQPERIQDVAIIGMAGRFSEAKNVDEFWKFLKIKKNTIRDYPQKRKEDLYASVKNPYYCELVTGTNLDMEKYDKVFNQSGYMDEIDKFDAEFFGISPLEADYMDPNQRIALEVAWEAIENSGYGGDCLKGTKTGVYIGREHSNYSFYKMCSENHSMQLTGSWEGMVASRISYFLNLKGPCIITDTACSGGAVSVHQAILSIVAGESDIALAGAINLSTTGEIKSDYVEGATLSSVESKDNHIRTFDGRANGTMWGEGVGIIVLKPLKKAIEDGDCIRAIIKSSAINNDGTSNSITAPNAITQEQVILDAWKKADIEPETISYVEAHGTGTVLGDPIEIKALSNAFRKYTNKKQFCAIGSLKTTMGHLVAASGIASIAKVVKSMETKTLAPIANFELPNPYINFMDSPFYINDTLNPWEPDAGVRRAIINSFGFIRTNCHMVLEEGIPYKEEMGKKKEYCLTISAKCENAIHEYVDKYLHFIEENPWGLKDICFTSNTGRGHYEYRILLIASSVPELAEKLCWIKEHEFTTVEDKGIFYGRYCLVSDKKSFLEPGDITAAMRKSSSNMAMANLERYLESKNYSELVNVARLYVQGADIQWDVYYRDEDCKRVQIPTYPLQRIRHWAKPMVTKVKGMVQTQLHPLVHQKTSGNEESCVFESILTVDDWVLADHKIEHNSVLPGTTYLEMIRFAFSNVTKKDKMEFKNVYFFQPLHVEKDEKKPVKLQLTKKNSRYSFQVLSEEDGKWILHAEGDVEILEEERPEEKIDIEAFKKTALDKMDPYIEDSDSGVFQFGKHWNTVRAVWQNENATLARLNLPDDLKDESNIFRLHPSMLDNAVNLISQNSDDTYLPYVYKSLKLFDNMPDEIYTYIKKKADKESNNETMTYHVKLTDKEGNIFATVFDYTVKKLELASFNLGGGKNYLSLEWTKDESADEVKQENIHWVTVVHNNPQGEELITALKATNFNVSPVLMESSDISRIFDELKNHENCGVIWALDYTADETMSDSYRREMGVDILFDFYKGLIEQRIKLAGGLKVLVGNAWKVDEKEETIDPYSAATASLAKVMKRESANMLIHIIDAGKDMAVDEIASKCTALHNTVTRAVRKTGTYVEIMKQKSIEGQASFEYKKDGVYVISGGLGGIGFVIAKKLSALPVKKIILLGRTELTDEGKEKVKSLVKAEYLKCDVTKEKDVAQVKEYLVSQKLKCDGIFHTAGISSAGYLVNKPKEYFNDVVSPKIDGTTNLYQLIEENMDAIFVMFSSITAITCEEGQADYCCANAFLDSFACKLVLEGRKAVAVNWPSWEEVGMAARLGITAEDYIFETMPVKEGMSWMDHFVATLENKVIPSKFIYENLVEYGDRLPFLLEKDIKDKMQKEDSQKEDIEDQQCEVQLTGCIEASKTEILVGKMYAKVLGLQEIDIYESFMELGGNSLMIAELSKEIDEVFPDLISVADLFSYSSISELAAYIDEITQSREKEKLLETENF